MKGGAANCCDIWLSMDQLARDVRRWNGDAKVLTARFWQGRTLAEPVAPERFLRDMAAGPPLQRSSLRTPKRFRRRFDTDAKTNRQPPTGHGWSSGAALFVPLTCQPRDRAEDGTN